MSDMMLRQARQSQDSISHQILTKRKLPKDWVVRKVGDVSSFVRKSNKHIDIPYVGLEDIESNTGSFLGSFEPRVVKSNTYFFEPNQILYGRLRPYLNKVMLPDFIGHCSTEIFPISVNKELVYPKYVFRWLMSFWIVDKINETTTGARMPRANPKDIVALEIPIPPLETQKKIVAVLDKAFAAIDLAKTNIEKNLQNAKELFQSKLNQTFTQKGDGWEEKKLGDLSYVKSGGTPLRSKKEFWDGGDIPWYSSGELNDIFTKKSKRFITDKGLSGSNAKLFPKGSLLIGMYDTAALKMSILDRDATFNQAIAGVEPSTHLNLIFILHGINAIKPELLKQRRGVRQKNLSLSKIKDIQLCVPPVAIQNQVVEVVDRLYIEINQVIHNYKRQASNLDDLKKSILQKAFAGKLEIK